MNQRGLSLIELVIVIVLIGAIAGWGFPRIGEALRRQSVSSARSAVVTLHAKARATAVQRARVVRLVFEGTRCVLRSQHPMTGATDTVGTVEDLYARHGVTVTVTRDSLVFDPRGLGTEPGPTEIVVRKGAWADTILISSVGRVLK